MRRVLSAVGRRVVHARGTRLARQFDRLTADALRTQQQTLERLLQLNAGTRFQKDHGLAPGLSVDDYRRRAPVTTYADVAPYVDDLRRGRTDALCGPRNTPLMFALSSGTTGDTKHIPITTRFLADYRRGWMVWAWHAFEAHPDASARKFLQLASDHNRYAAPIRPGDVISVTRRFVDVVERDTKRGPMVFFTSELRWDNQDSGLVRLGEQTSIYY